MLKEFARNESVRKFYNTAKKVIFPLIIILFAMIKVNKGINLQDTTYSLGNYRFFPESRGVWFLLTYVSNAVGYLLTILPFGKTMLGIKIYSSAIIALMGLLSYRFFMTKMPAWLSFLTSLMAVGICWAPSTILYHYLTYFFLMLGAMLLFRGLAGERKSCLVLAGVSLGINAFVRFPGNGLEILLILPLVMYGVLMKKKSSDIWKEVGLCVAGYAGAALVILTIMSFTYGANTFANLVSGAFGIAGSASDYTFSQMILSIISAYLHGMKWALYIVICALMGVPFFLLFKDKYMKARKIFYCLCIAFLFFVLGRWGMYNFKYYQKESALQWGVIFLMISIVVDIWTLFTKRVNYDWKLLGGISLVIILITPLGSNNYVWPNLNNLFFVAPVTVWTVYRFVRWGRTYLDSTGKVPLFAFKAMLMACVLMFALQCAGVGLKYVFMEGEDGKDVSFYVSDNEILKGMKTTQENAKTLSQLSSFVASKEAQYNGKELVLYGNIPGLSYILDRPSALNTSWSDLDSNPVEEMDRAINSLPDTSVPGTYDPKDRPLVIISKSLYDLPDNSIKLDMINGFIEKNNYKEAFVNDAFVVFE